MPTSTIPTQGFRISELKPFLTNINLSDLVLVSQLQSDKKNYKSTAITYETLAVDIASTISDMILQSVQDMNHVLISKRNYEILSSTGIWNGVMYDDNTLYMISDDVD